MNRSARVAAAALLALGACRSARVETGPAAGVQPAPPTAAALPAGSALRVELKQTLSTDDSRVGDRFNATVTDPIIAQNGQTVIPRGAVVHGVVTGLDDSDRPGDQAAIRLNFDAISFGGRSYPFSADVIEADVELDEVERAVTGAAIGAVAGAALGAIIGGDLAEILIGGALGAGAGTIISLGVGDVEATLPAGTDMTLRTTRTIQLR